MGVKHDVADFFRNTFEESGVADHVAMFLNLGKRPGCGTSHHPEGCPYRGGIPGI